jgi:hypothetical protein
MAKSTQSHEQHFLDTCEDVSKALLDAANSLYRRDVSLASTIHSLQQTGLEVSAIMVLAEIMTAKCPRCTTILISTPNYYRGEFQDICRNKILPTILGALKALQECEKVVPEVNILVAEQLELAQDELVFALDGCE